MPIISHQFLGKDQPLHSDYQSAAITANDSVDVPTIPGLVCVGVYVGSTGNVAGTSLNGVAVSFASVPANTVLDVGLSRVRATGTTATALQALYRPSER